MSKAMASLCLNSLSLPPPRKVVVETSSSSSPTPSIGYRKGEALKPIVVSGNPPTFVSAPGRRIVAGSYIFLLTFFHCFLILLLYVLYNFLGFSSKISIKHVLYYSHLSVCFPFSLIFNLSAPIPLVMSF